MKIFKKLGIIICLTLFINILPAFANPTFDDVGNNDPNKDAIEYLYGDGIIEGYSDGSFKSLNKINRAEFMKIVIGALEDFDIEKENKGNCFTDVNEEWFAPYICYAKDKDIVSGYSDGTFKPANEINFAEASKIVVNANNLNLEGTEGADPWYKQYVVALEEKNAIPLSISDLDKNIARGEMADVIFRIKEENDERESLKFADLEALPVTVNSCPALLDYFDEFALYNNHYYEFEEFAVDDVVEPVTSMGDSAKNVASRTVSESPTSGLGGMLDDESDDYSSTNLQVYGVDEADFVKNDGKYIYMVKDGEIKIIEAYPSDELKELSTITIEDELYADNIYVDGDSLVVISSKYNYTYDEPIALDKSWVPSFHSNRTAVLIYNISDREKPRLFRHLEFDGNEVSSRKVNDTLYLVLNNDIYYYGDKTELTGETLIPRYNDSVSGDEEYLGGCNDVLLFPRQRNFNQLIALAVPLKTTDKVESQVMVGNSDNVYSSKDSLYIAATNYESTYDYYLDWDNEKTVVYKFDLEPGNIEYNSRGKVPGSILNQFSMDEHKDHFRIATTTGDIWSSETPSKNNVYILDEDMKVVGEIEDIAPGEHIYSTRFMGDRGYMVTFKKVDPLFVFDLSDPENPEILGKLKIPGFSDYLHPYDENHIIGFGKDTILPTEEEAEKRSIDFEWYQGMKIALFDVTDPENPEQKFVEIIGDRGTSSPLLNDHKALLFDKDKELLAFPVTVSEVENKDPENPSQYGETVFDGAYVYNFNLEDGFKLRGKITHYSDDDDSFEKQGDYWYGNYNQQINRLLYIGENLYSIANGGIKVSDINSIKEKNYLELEESETYKYDDVVY